MEVLLINYQFPAMGLQLKFSSFQWIASIPPILIVLGYKIYINRVYLPAFNFFNPTEEELSMAKVHSERADHKGNRLERRFGHPALHAELFTPMLHKNMMPLLSQVYQGKIATDKARLGGQQMEAQVVPGGIKIAAVDQVNLFPCGCIVILIIIPPIYRMTSNMTPFSISAIVVKLTGINGRFHQ